MIVLDTSVVSYIFSRDRRARYYIERIRGRRALISFQTLEEIWYGAYSKDWGEIRMSELTRHARSIRDRLGQSRVGGRVRPLAQRAEIGRAGNTERGRVDRRHCHHFEVPLGLS